MKTIFSNGLTNHPRLDCKTTIAGIEGVVEVNSFGGYLKQVEVAVNPELLKSKDVTLLKYLKH